MVRRNHLLLGQGARCSVLLSKLRPSRDVEAAFPNRLPTQRLEDLVAVWHEAITRRGLTYDGVFFMSESIPGIQLSAARRFVTVKEQGPDESLWDAPASNPPTPGSPPVRRATTPVPDVTVLIDEAVFQANGSRAEDIAMVRNLGFDVDDDNEPVPENIPSPDAPLPVDHGLYEGQSWGWDGRGCNATIL